jgi:integrin alpha FG-GAP repeat containing protein 1
LPAAVGPQPTVFDITGDMKPDLLGYPADAPDQLHIWRNVYDASQNESLFEKYTCSPLRNLFIHFVRRVPVSKLPFTKGQLCRIATPHSNAFVDLDGDCLAGVNGHRYQSLSFLYHFMQICSLHAKTLHIKYGSTKKTMGSN